MAPKSIRRKKYVYSLLHLACEKEYIEATKLLIENRTDVHRSTPLHHAFADAYMEIVKCLLEHGAEINSKNKYGWMSLHLACSKGHLEVAKWLIENGASVSAKSKDQETALHHACGNERWKIAMFLENGADMDSKQDDGTTPLHEACRNGHLGVVQLLMSRGVNANAETIEGTKPLYLASKWNESFGYCVVSGAPVSFAGFGTFEITDDMA